MFIGGKHQGGLIYASRHPNELLEQNNELD